jgi:hypothetical protein
MNEVESLASEILPASEVDGLDSSDKFSALRQAYMRDTGLSNYHEAEIIVISDDDSSDASTVIIKRVIEGRDGRIRTVALRTPEGNKIIRPIQLVIPLEVDQGGMCRNVFPLKIMRTPPECMK